MPRRKADFRKERLKALKKTKRFVRYGYESSLEFKSGSMSPQEAAKVVKLVKSYNEYRGAAVAKAVLKLKNIAGSIQFGREYSPVLYVEIPYWTNQKANPSAEEKKNPRKYTDAERMKISNNVERILKSTKPDELWYEKGYMRAWWD